MDTEHYKPAPGADDEPRHADVTFEPVDVQVHTIYWYLFALGLAVALSLLACVYIFRFTASLSQESDTPPTTAMQQMTEKMTREEKDAMQYNDMSEPRLQGVPGSTNDPQEDLRQKINTDRKANDTLMWVDRTNGIAQIPVSEAMKIIAEKGIPPISTEKKK